MAHTPLPAEIIDLCLRAQRACNDVATAHAALHKTRAQTRQLITLACQTHPIGWCASAVEGIVPPISLTKRDPDETAHEAVCAIRVIRDEFPLRRQIAIMKVPGACIAVLAQQRQQAPSVLSA